MPTVSNLPRLMVRDASGNEREVEIAHLPFNLGRQSDNDLVLLDNRISRRHARIIKDERGFTIEDLGSRHGTFINGDRVESTVLKGGDQISLGVVDSYQIIFNAEDSKLPTLLEKFGKTADTAARAPAQQLQHLGLLLQMAQLLHKAAALEEVLTTLVDSALQLTDGDRGLLFMREDSGELNLKLARGRGGVHLGSKLTDYSQQVLARVAASGREEVSIEDEKTGHSATETGIIGMGMRGVVAVPLQKHPMMETGDATMIRTAPELMGVLYLDSRSRPTSITGLDRQVLQTLALEGATVIENARLFRLTREQERIQHELELASNIQRGLLPRKLPESNFFEVHAVTVQTRTVGGDYYDVITVPGDRFGLTVADVSGKGLAAAMMASTLQGAFSVAAAGAPDHEELFRRINEFLCERTPSEMYATMFYGVLNRAGRLNFVTAGHPPPILIHSSGAIERLESANFPIGLLPGVSFTVDSTRLENSDALVIYSDGVTEAQDINNELFGEERLLAVLRQHAQSRAEVISNDVIAAVNDFVGGAPQADDLTLLVIRFGPR